MVDYDVEEEQKEEWSILRVGGSVAEILTEKFNWYHYLLLDGMALL